MSLNNLETYDTTPIGPVPGPTPGPFKKPDDDPGKRVQPVKPVTPVQPEPKEPKPKPPPPRPNVLPTPENPDKIDTQGG